MNRLQTWSDLTGAFTQNGRRHPWELPRKVPTFQIFRGDAQVRRYWGSSGVLFAEFLVDH